MRLSGAVVLAYLADKAPLWAAIIIVALLNINFAIAICVQAARVHKLFTMHCIVRNFWLDNRPELLRRLQANKISKRRPSNNNIPAMGSHRDPSCAIPPRLVSAPCRTV